jgi:hypothetical protein
MRKLLVGFALVLLISTAAYFRFRHSKNGPELAYVGNRQVTLWSTSAQVRESVGTVSYGERLQVLSRFQEQVQVRTTTGLTGWITQNDLLSSEMWQKAKDLESKTATLPIEARGHTRALSNLHIGPGRDTPRIRQLSKMAPVDLFERQVTEVAAAAVVNAKEGLSSSSQESTPPTAKKEDWWLVRAHFPDQTTSSGWILGRFLDLDVPSPLPDYANSAGMRIVAWFELNRVPDAASGQLKPQYLLVGAREPEGEACDFTLMRVYTWGKQKERYETAFVESDVCGKLPVKLTAPAASSADATFSFEDWTGGVAQQRIYVMHQTIVRELRKGGAAPRRKHAR